MRDYTAPPKQRLGVYHRMWVVVIPVKSRGAAQVDTLTKNNRVGAELYLRLLQYLSPLTRSTSMRYSETVLVINLVSPVCITPKSSMEQPPDTNPLDAGGSGSRPEPVNSSSPGKDCTTRVQQQSGVDPAGRVSAREAPNILRYL